MKLTLRTTLALAASHLLQGALAEGDYSNTDDGYVKKITVWSAPGCGRNEESIMNDASFMFTAERKYFNDDPEGDFGTACPNVHGWSWPGFGDKNTEDPAKDESGHPYLPVWFDGGDVDDNCKLIFYNEDPSDDVFEDVRCRFYFRIVSRGSGCARVNLPEKYQYVYCCGGYCDKQRGINTSQKRRSLLELDEGEGGATVRSVTNKAVGAPAVRDVAAVKRAAPLALAGGPLLKKRDDTCGWKGETDVKYRWGRPKVSSPEVDCRHQSEPCGVSATYDTSVTVGTSTSLGFTAGISAGFMGIGASVGFETSVTEEWSKAEGFSQTFDFSFGKGERGIITFRPKYRCVRGRFESTEGDCKTLADAGEDWWCVPDLKQEKDHVIPQGSWMPVQF